MVDNAQKAQQNRERVANKQNIEGYLDREHSLMGYKPFDFPDDWLNATLAPIDVFPESPDALEELINLMEETND